MIEKCGQYQTDNEHEPYMYNGMQAMKVNISLFLCIFASVASATQTTHSLVEQALDEPASITLEKVRLADAMAMVTEQTGVTIRMSPEVMDLVPHGADTLIERVDIANLTLREGLKKLFGPLGMTFEVGDRDIEIVPLQAIYELGRRPTWSELNLLQRLTALTPGVDKASLETLKSIVQIRVATLDAWDVLASALRTIGPGSGDQVLQVACNQLGWSWWLEDKVVVVGSFDQQLRRQLQLRITLKYNGRPLIDALQALGQAVGITVRAEPAAIASLPPHVQQRFSVNVEDETAERVLERIAAYTGLGYMLTPQGVVFYNPKENVQSANTNEPQKNPMRSGYAGKIIVPLKDGTTIEWLISFDELPQDLQKRRQQDLAKAFEKIRHQDNN